MGFFDWDFDKSYGRLVIARHGWVYLACTIPLTLIVLGLSFTWMWWTGKKEEKPHDYSTKEAIVHAAQAADIFHFQVRPGQQSV
jgi:TRAP-type C4-dicarboxylate transport system permease large subunit